MYHHDELPLWFSVLIFHPGCLVDKQEVEDVVIRSRLLLHSKCCLARDLLLEFPSSLLTYTLVSLSVCYLASLWQDVLCST